MKYTKSEKMEIIRMVEESSLSVKQTLREMDVPHSSFYKRYGRYKDEGYDGLASKHKNLRQVWNKIPEWEKERLVEAARKYPEKSCREIAWLMTDKREYFIAECSVYRILKVYDLVTSPVFTLVSAKDKFEHPTTRTNELWQTDFTYLKVVHWGWYYLSTVMDEFSRYIIAWQLCRTMKAKDVKNTLDMAIAETGGEHVQVVQRPRLLSDNGACFISHELKKYLETHEIRHARTKVYNFQRRFTLGLRIRKLGDERRGCGDVHRGNHGLSSSGADDHNPLGQQKLLVPCPRSRRNDDGVSRTG